MKKYVLFSLVIFISLIESCKKPDTKPTPPVASFTFTTNGYVAAFKSTSTNKPTTLTWNFGDSSATATGDSILHTYKTSGTYSVQLTATNGGGSNTTKMEVIIKEQIVQIHTSFGDMFMWLYNERPEYKANYIKLVSTHFYDSTTFHRVAPNFVIQGGDSLSKDADTTNDGQGGPDEMPFETGNGITHVYGAVGSASKGYKQPGNNWQFYIVTNKMGDHQLDPNYTVFGFIMKGMDVANVIQNQKADPISSRPYKAIRMSTTILNETKAEILANYGYTVK